MGCCVGSQKVEINERDITPDIVAKEDSDHFQEGNKEEVSNNKDVDSGYDDEDNSKQSRTSTPRKQQTSTPTHTPRKYKTLDAMEKVYKTNPAFIPAIKYHPDIKRLTPRESTDRCPWATPRTLENIPEVQHHERPSTFGGTTANSRESFKEFSNRPRTMYGMRSPRPSTRDSVTTTRTIDSRASITGVKLGIISESLVSDVPWDMHYDSYARTPSRQKSSFELQMSELERRYKRSKPPGYSKKRRRSQMKGRMRKQAISLDKGVRVDKSSDENE